MKRCDLFYVVFVLTILITRVLVWLVPEGDIIFGSFVVHHFWFGIVLFVIGLIFVKGRVWFYGVGLGLIADQLVFMILGAGKDAEYWALLSVLSMVIIAAIVYLIRENLISDQN